MDLLPQSKLKLIPDLLEREGCEAWIVLSREHNHDLLGADFGLHPIGDYAVVFDRDGRRLALTDNYFAPSLRGTGIFEVTQFVESDYFVELEKFVKRLDGKKVAVDISSEYSVAGGLASSLFQKLKRILPGATFVSSENIVMELRAVLNEEEQGNVRKAIRLSEEILHEVEVNFLHVGMGESQLFLETQKLVRERTDGFAWHEIVNPLLIIGDSDIFESGSIESKKKIEAGDLINIDLGVLYRGYVSDITYTYVVKGGRSVESEKIRMFETVRGAKDAAKQALKEGVTGASVDRVAREYILKNNLPSYDHVLGHVMSRVAHEIGPLLAPPWPRYGKKTSVSIRAGMVMTVEPSVFLKGMGTILMEDNVLITRGGYEDLSSPQQELIVLN
jgi:Xaa-Pro aminopeptidase